MSTIVSCPICLEPFDNPKSLQCGHSLCEQCANNLVKRNPYSSRQLITCPKCRTPTLVPEDGLPTNFDLKTIVERNPEFRRKSVSKPGSRICLECHVGNAVELWNCANCYLASKRSELGLICASCAVEKHNGHKLVKLSELEKNKRPTMDAIAEVEQNTKRHIGSLNRHQPEEVTRSKRLLTQLLETNYTQKYKTVVSDLEKTEICTPLVCQRAKTTVTHLSKSFDSMMVKIDEDEQKYLDSLQERISTLSPKVLMHGGRHTEESFEFYHPTYGSEEIKFESLPRNGRSGHIVATLGEKICIAGGCDRRSRPLTSTEFLDPLSKKTTDASDMSVPRIEAASAVFEDKIFAFGGHNKNRTELSVEMMSVEAQQWKLLKNVSLESAHHGAKAVRHNDSIYLLAGSVDDAVSNTALTFDPHSGSFSPCKTLKHARLGHGAALCDNNTLIVAGGLCGPYRLNQCERFDPRANFWMDIACLKQARFGLNLVNFGGRLLALGGLGFDDQALRTVEEYDSRNDKWTFVTSLAHDRYLFRSALATFY